MNQGLLVITMGALPISEIRGAIPLALSFGFSPVAAYTYAFIGNALVVGPLILFLKYGSAWVIGRGGLPARILHWVFERTRRKNQSMKAAAGPIALAFFVAMPLPMTGAWTAAIIAFLFDMPLRRSYLAILLGVAAAGLIVLALSLGVISLS
jgi:uncharacterized membrane protein